MGSGWQVEVLRRGSPWDSGSKVLPPPSFPVRCLYRITEDSAVTTFEALKARVRELERQLSRGDRYKCLICMVSRKESRHTLGQLSAPWAPCARKGPSEAECTSGTLSLPTFSLGLLLDASDVDPVLACAL